jgi:hypothetical protein
MSVGTSRWGRASHRAAAVAIKALSHATPRAGSSPATLGTGIEASSSASGWPHTLNRWKYKPPSECLRWNLEKSARQRWEWHRTMEVSACLHDTLHVGVSCCMSQADSQGLHALLGRDVDPFNFSTHIFAANVLNNVDGADPDWVFEAFHASRIGCDPKNRRGLRRNRRWESCRDQRSS